MSGGDGGGGGAQVTILFADIVGFTSMSSLVPPLAAPWPLPSETAHPPSLLFCLVFDC